MSLVVVKLGAQSPATRRASSRPWRAQHEVCVVHGAGPQISAEMERLGLDVTFVGGRRVTSAAGLEVVRASFAAVNSEICAALGPLAVPLFGDEIGLQATPVPELGLVGEALPSRPAAVVDALAAGKIPVVAPLADGPLNVNADEAAAALAIGLHADRILFLTDVPGPAARRCGRGDDRRRRGGADARRGRAQRRDRSQAAGGDRRGPRRSAAEIGATAVLA